jgi:hypothetical protein
LIVDFFEWRRDGLESLSRALEEYSQVKHQEKEK